MVDPPECVPPLAFYLLPPCATTPACKLSRGLRLSRPAIPQPTDLGCRGPRIDVVKPCFGPGGPRIDVIIRPVCALMDRESMSSNPVSALGDRESMSSKPVLALGDRESMSSNPVSALEGRESMWCTPQHTPWARSTREGAGAVSKELTNASGRSRSASRAGKGLNASG